MSRDASGNYTLPVGNPVVTDTVIESNWANDTMSDVKTEITNSLDRQGKGGMLAPLKGTDGTKAAPAFSFTNAFSTGFYRAGTNDVRLSLNAIDFLKVTASSFTYGSNTLVVSATEFTYGADALVVSATEFTFASTILFADATTFTFNGSTVLVEGAATATQIEFDNTVTGVLPASNVQAAIDLLSVGVEGYYSLPHTGGGDLTVGAMNELLDSSTYDLPLAGSTLANALIGIRLPDTYSTSAPIVQRKGADVITSSAGSDTDMQFFSATTIWLTSDGVDTWRY